MRRIIIEFLIGVPIVIVVYALLEFLYCTFFTHTPFVFNFITCGEMLLVWLVVEIVTYFIRKNKE